MIFYVRNLPLNATEAELKAVFEPLGEVASVTLLQHERTGRPVGVGVVDMPEVQGLGPVTEALTGVQIDGRTLDVGARGAGDRRSGPERRAGGREDRDRRSAARRLHPHPPADR